MAKYVDVEKVFCADCEDRDRCGTPDVFCDVHSMPAADVAPVVRCKDCKFCKSTFDGENDFCTVWDADESETAYVTEYDFCSYGERKENG